MANNISAMGVSVRVVASRTFPAGFTVTQFADDADPIDLPSVQVMETAMGVNGDLVIWSRANPLTATINVIPGSDDDKNLAILLEANRPGRGKTSAMDEITLTVVYPDGSTLTLTGGVITDGPPGLSIASAGRQKSMAYAFAFENKSTS